jgi:lipopolysaccharide export system protein LptC
LTLLRSLLPIALLLIMAVASTWYLTRLEADLEAARSTESTAARLKGREVTLTIFDENGAIDHRLVAERVHQGPAGSGTDLIHPRLAQYRDGFAVTTGTALAGWVSEDRERVRMLNDVELTHRPDPDAPETRLLTEFLEYEPGPKRATTDRLVTIVRPGLRVEGVGMRADLINETVHLLSQVRGTHEQTP